MAIRPILIHPDPRLKAVAEPVADIDDGIHALADDLLETMYDAPGSGLAATQIGVMQRLFVIGCGLVGMGEQFMGSVLFGSGLRLQGQLESTLEVAERGLEVTPVQLELPEVQ